MPTPHNNAAPGAFAKTVLMPGDPLRSKFIAETFLENPVLVPRRSAPRATKSRASLRSAMPPAALIFTWGATWALKRATSSRVAPPPPKPVEVLMYSAPESDTTRHISIFSASVSIQVSMITFSSLPWQAAFTARSSSST